MKKFTISDENKKKIECAMKRALHTVAQTAIVNIGGAVVLSDVNWTFVISSCMLTGIVSLIKSFAVGMPECK